MNEPSRQVVPAIAPTAKPDQRCPRCGAGPEKRKESCGFGRRYELMCGACGYVFGADTRPGC